MASTGECAILEVNPQSLHQRVPVILGGVEEVTTLCAALADDR